MMYITEESAMSWDIWLAVDVDGQSVELPDTWRNYTHNCNRMVRDAGLEEWPYEVAGWSADRLGRRLADTIECLERDPEKYRAMNPANGWGDYDSLLVALREVLASCERYPSARVGMSA